MAHGRTGRATVPAKPNALAVAVPFCAMAVVVAADLVTGPQVGLLPVLSLGPALAPVALSPVRSVLTGVLAIALSLALAAFDGLWFISAAAAARIGGDLYDVVAAQGTTRLIVADVQGKGLAAVQTAAVVLAAFRESAYDAADLVAIADHIERSLGHQAPGGKFVTAIMAELPLEGAEIRLLNCGHPAPLLVSSGQAGLAEPLEAALPLGLSYLVADDRREHTVPFGPGDSMLFYTDGISEARDRSGSFYQPVRRGARALLAGPDPDTALDVLYVDVLGHVGGHLHDDSAALLIRRERTLPGRRRPERTG